MTPGRLIVVLFSAAICALTIALVLLRLFGVLFFWSEVSKWAIVPAITIIALLLATNLRQRPRRLLAGTLLLWYILSVYFEGWDVVMKQITEGANLGVVALDAAEAALIALFALFCFLPRGQPRTTDRRTDELP